LADRRHWYRRRIQFRDLVQDVLLLVSAENRDT
jgi:hypothetical protein